ncbi:hypothetical protein K4749_28465 [Streptomyces sp. TRM72054]|uniref:alpha-L-rhamnosidase-related protein n=1 Tax=Streptomyces sp. TRM72054 TaxID=2870562 RepID=UPI001C8CDD03|nr:hypothetical protein [Streptomyces sp. TRM72054]MBX9397414.1 hypothetical protein [Streptomyces sp. TRM72054]
MIPLGTGGEAPAFGWQLALTRRAISQDEAAASDYRKLSADIRDAFTEAYVAADGTVRRNSQTGYAMALGMNLVTDPALVEPLLHRGSRAGDDPLGGDRGQATGRRRPCWAPCSPEPREAGSPAGGYFSASRVTAIRSMTGAYGDRWSYWL